MPGTRGCRRHLERPTRRGPWRDSLSSLSSHHGRRHGRSTMQDLRRYHRTGTTPWYSLAPRPMAPTTPPRSMRRSRPRPLLGVAACSSQWGRTRSVHDPWGAGGASQRGLARGQRVPVLQLGRHLGASCGDDPARLRRPWEHEARENFRAYPDVSTSFAVWPV
jgi:hypothetical protein